MTMNGVDLNAAASRVANSLSLPVFASNKQAAGPTGVKANTTASTSTASAADDGSQITSSDFLTLLVTEMKNQDPTQPTDPNAYIQQLVGVNSLQQLIAINGDLSGLNTPATGTSNISSATSAI